MAFNFKYLGKFDDFSENSPLYKRAAWFASSTGGPIAYTDKPKQFRSTLKFPPGFERYTLTKVTYIYQKRLIVSIFII